MFAVVVASPAKAPRSPAELDELTLARAQRGDEAAARALVERYQRPVFALLSRLCGTRSATRELIDDLAQETFLRAFRALPSFDKNGPARLSTWILTIATRLALDALRRPNPSAEPLDAAAGVAAPARADETAERWALAAAIEHAVLGLHPDQRAVFILRQYHDLDYADIARALAIDLGTVKSRLSRARAVLRQALAEVSHA